MSIEEGKNKKNINDILAAATAENDALRTDIAARTYEHTIVSLASEEPEASGDAGSGEVSADTRVADTPPRTRAEAEADRIVSSYSERRPQPELSSTADLQGLLSTTAERRLLPEETSAAPRKASRLGNMIEDAKMQTAGIDVVPHMQNRQVPAAAERFTDPVGHIHPRSPVQESMFDLDGESPDEALTTEIETVKFDDDYEALSAKIESGEIEFDSEPVDDTQTVMSKEADDLVAVNDDSDGDRGGQRAETRSSAFEMMDDKTEGDDDFDAALGRISEARRKKQKKQKQKPKEYEYTSREQNNDVHVMLRRAVKKSALKTLACFLFTVLILILELAQADSSLPSFLKQGRYGELYILIDLQLLLFCGLIMLGSLKNGAKGLISLKPNTDSLITVSFAITAIYSIVLLTVDPTSESLRLYSLPAATACLCRAFAEYLCCRKDYHCFRVIAKKHKKYAALELGGVSPEAAEFARYLSPDSDIYTVKHTDFCDGMFRRVRKNTKSEQVLAFIIPVILIMALIIFGILSWLGKPLIDAYAAATLVVLISTPLTAFFMVTLPVVRINRIGRHTSSAFVGNSVAEEYADAGVLSFADTEVYPSKNIRVVSVKAYGNFRLDNIIPGLASAFSLIGGPLASVLANMVEGDVSAPDDSRLTESAADGICMSVSGKDMHIGKYSYMRRNGIDAPLDNGDTAYEKKNGTVMYVAVDGKLAAKVYLIYTLSERFNSLLQDMYRAGLCLGVKTLDPNITDEMLKRDIKFKRCPITVIKCARFGESTDCLDRVDSGIVTNGSLHTFLKMFVLCDKARHAIRSNIVITMADILLSTAAVCFFALTGSVFELTSIYALLFQLVWLLPVWILSLLL